MILVSVYRTKNGLIYSVKIKNHGEALLCAAVSALVINTVNSIKVFTDDMILIKKNEINGFICFELPNIKNGSESKKSTLLLDSLVLGLNGIAAEYSGIKIKDTMKLY